MMSLNDATQAMHGQLRGSPAAHFNAVEFDSRAVQEQDLFFAIRGVSQDGHQYVDAAIKQGALAAVMDEKGAQQYTLASGNAIIVTDTTHALGDLARHWRQQFTLPVVGVTGSNGKTTVSRIISQIFSEAIPGISPQGSFNNHWGVPYTLLKLREGHQSAVIEMGMNHPGEISYLAQITKPTIGVITNAAAAHLQALKNVQGVAKAKGELITFVADNGHVILNRDDDYFEYWRDLADQRAVISFGSDNNADLYFSAVKGDQFTLHYQDQQLKLTSALLGQHNRLNVLAAAAAAIAAGVSLEHIACGVSKVQPVSGRLERKVGVSDIHLIDDTYNANPASMRAAIDVLREFSGQKVLILGAMGELGDSAAEQHFAVGEYAKNAGVAQLLVLSDQAQTKHLAEQYLAGFGQGHSDDERARCFKHLDALLAQLGRTLNSESVALIKGSRAAQMERVVRALQIEGESC